MSFRQSFVEVDGCRTHLRRGGSGAPLLFLHGASGAPAILPFMEKLAQRFEVLVPEHPGYGLTDEPEWLDNIHDLGYFYLDFLKRLDLENVTLVGSSLGGWIGLEMAVRDTSRLRALVLVSPAGLRAPGVQPADTFLMSRSEIRAGKARRADHA
jgi:pimeloyl-ACP methyl ester carboxylesterase